MAFHGLTQSSVTHGQVAIAISEGVFGAHIAIVFQQADATVTLLHLAEHRTVKVNPVSSSNQCWAQCMVDLPAVLSKQVVAIFRAVSIKPPEIPYGLNLLAASGSFDPLGNYTPQAESDGLTCASFVSELFRGMGLNLVDVSTWPKTLENIEWGNSVIRFVESRGANASHVATLGNSNVGLRLHPFEVAAAVDAGSHSWPLGYGQAHSGMAAVAGALTRICPKSLLSHIRRILTSVR